MFKKKPGKSTYAISESRQPGSDFATLIDKLQRNADEVEKNIIETEQFLKRDIKKINEGRHPLYQEDINKTILNSLELLKSLDEDAAEASRLQHPQSEMIEKHMRQLRVRVMKLREEHDCIYNLTRLKQVSTVNWGKMIDEKLASVNNKGFGPDLLTIENEMEEHNIFHSEVEALVPSITGDRDDFDDQQAKYNKLLASSTARQKNLLGLRDYMLRYTNELYWMEQQAEERKAYDWSDNNLGYPDRKRQYEVYISTCLESKANTITQLKEDGEELIEQNHPAKNIIGAQMDAMHKDWKEFLNLLFCEENHLKNMDDYHKFHMDARDSNSVLECLETEINQKHSPEFKDMYQMDGLIADLDNQVKAIARFNEQLKALQKRSLQVLPLKYRRETPQKLLLIEALCDYETNEGSILRGERYTLLRNNGLKWDVKDTNGHTMHVPGVCFIFPPIDPEAVAIVDNLINMNKVITQKVLQICCWLQAQLAELKKESTGDKQEQQCRQLIAELDKVRTQDDSEWEVKRPSEVMTDANIKYSVSSSEGQHECSETGFRWRSDSDVSLEYRFVDWESLSKDIMKDYKPCGPLMDITVTSGTLEEIQLPHFVCVDSESSSDDAVKFIHVKDGTVSMEICELSGSHAKLVNPTFSLLGVIANVRQYLTMKFHCETLIYCNRTSPLNLHVYLILKDEQLKKDVEEKETIYTEIVKPKPNEGLTMFDYYTLKTSCNAKIHPMKLKLMPGKTNFFDLHIKDEEECLELSIETKEGQNIWDVNIESAEWRQTTFSTSNRSSQNLSRWRRLAVKERSTRGAEFVEKHMAELIRRVSLVEPIADEIKDLIGDEKYQTILNSGTNQNKMRTLLNFLTTPKLKDRLYQSLVKCERSVVEYLEYSGKMLIHETAE